MAKGLCPLYVCGDGSSPIIDIDVLVVFPPSGVMSADPECEPRCVRDDGCGSVCGLYGRRVFLHSYLTLLSYYRQSGESENGASYVVHTDVIIGRALTHTVHFHFPIMNFSLSPRVAT